VRVELFADSSNGNAPVRQELKRGQRITGLINGFVFAGSAPADRPATEYTPRVVPAFPRVAVPLEAAQILWQK